MTEKDIVVLCHIRERVHGFRGHICRGIKQQPSKKVLQMTGCLSDVHKAKMTPGLCLRLSDIFCQAVFYYQS